MKPTFLYILFFRESCEVVELIRFVFLVGVSIFFLSRPVPISLKPFARSRDMV